jgi:hypothetical protein
MEISQKEIQVLEKQASPLIKEAQGYKIESVESVEKASVFLRKLKDTENMIEAKRLEFTKPLNQSLRAINATFKKVKEPLVEARNLLTGKVITWKTAERERLEAEEARRRKIQEAHEKKGHEVKAPVVLDRPDNQIGSTRTRKVWTFEVVDFSKVPDSYKTISSPSIMAQVRSGVREIPGLKIYQKEGLAIV